MRRRSVSCVSAPTPPNCVSASSTKIKTRSRASSGAAEPLEDHVRLAVPLAADALQDEHRNVEFAGDGLEDEGLAAADRAGHGGARKGIGPPDREPWQKLVREKLLQPAVADHVAVACASALSNSTTSSPSWRLDKLFDLGDHVGPARPRLPCRRRPGGSAGGRESTAPP